MDQVRINELIARVLFERFILRRFQSDPPPVDASFVQLVITRLKELYCKMPADIGLPKLFELFEGSPGHILVFRQQIDESEKETQSRFECCLSDLIRELDQTLNKLQGIRRLSWDAATVDVARTESAVESFERLIADLDELYESVYPSDPALLLSNELKVTMPLAFSRLPFWDQRALQSVAEFGLQTQLSQLDTIRKWRGHRDSTSLKRAIAARREALSACVAEITGHAVSYFPAASETETPVSGPGADKQTMPQSVGIVTIIGPEMEAVKQAFGITEEHRVTGNGTLSYELMVPTKFNGRIRLVVWAIGQPGNTTAAADAATIIERGIRFLLLCGIAAGIKGKVKIGDVVIPRSVVDTTQKVFEDGALKGRPLITSPLKGVFQMNASSKISTDIFEAEYLKLNPGIIVVPAGKEKDFAENVAAKPSIHESALLTDNVLHRNPAIMVDAQNDLHQQIRAADMEAGGFVIACINKYPPIPWFIVRGISDFGDQFKNDLFHVHAAKAAAAYLWLYVTQVLDLRIWRIADQPPDNTTSQLWLSELIAQVAGLGEFSQFPALNSAFTVTYGYLSQLQISDSEIDLATRLQLSMLWLRAAQEVLSHDEDLYKTCFEKYAYWADPGRWEAEELDKAGLSYSDLLEKLRGLGITKRTDGAVTGVPATAFFVEFIEGYLDGHMMVEPAAGRGSINMVAPKGMNDWSISETIEELRKTPQVVETLPSLKTGKVNVLVGEELYRTWRRKQFITLSSMYLNYPEHSLLAGIPLGPATVTGSFKPSVWTRVMNALNQQQQTIDFDFEMSDGSLCTVRAEVIDALDVEANDDGSVQASVELEVKASSHLFSQYRSSRRFVCQCSPDKVEPALSDVLSDLGWKRSVANKARYFKKHKTFDGEESAAITFQADVRIERSEHKAIVRLDVWENARYNSPKEVAELANAIVAGLQKQMHD